MARLGFSPQQAQQPRLGPVSGPRAPTSLPRVTGRSILSPVRPIPAPRVVRVGLFVGIGLLVALTTLSFSAPGHAAGASPAAHPFVNTNAVPAAPQPTPASASPSATASALSLGIVANPRTICAFGLDTCAAATGTSRVTLTASAGSGGVIAWPAVQVAFVVETTAYDGVYDPSAYDPGTDPCAQPAGSTNLLCEESNAVPFFIANAQSIANAIQTANPHSQVSFALVDYFATLSDWDDGDGAEYHVDIPQFIAASNFGSEVVSTFQANVLQGGWVYSDSDMSDNNFHSSVITALYGTIIGSGLDWSNNTHHVIVWMGSTAPRDPNYPVNLCISSEDQYYSNGNCNGATCEPSYQFATGTSPNCEGWVKSQDGNQSHSIAALAHEVPQCTGSIGGVCTIDTIDVWTTPTDPLSQGWPANGNGHPGGGPGGTVTQQNVARILLAGCDMAAATGGTWNGPAWFSCPNGQAGSLQYVPHGKVTQPNTNNPTLFNAFKQVGFGPVLETQVAAGSNRPIFSFVPFGNIALATDLEPTAACVRNAAPLATCQTVPTVLHFEGVTYLGWNWSRNASSNVMYIGDFWTASFNIVATGPPYTLVPIDACTTTDCKAGGSGAILGLYTSATYVPYTNNTVITQSFPLGQITVQVTPPTAPPPNVPPPPPPVPPPFPIIAPSPLPVIQQIGIGNNVGVANVSLQAAAAGFLGAGFMRVGMKNRPIAMRVAAKSGKITSMFDKGLSSGEGGIGHFE